MSKTFAATLASLFTILVLAGCGGGTSPVLPDGAGSDNITGASSPELSDGNRVLWGMWHCFNVDGSSEIQIEPLRTANFTANINNLLAKHPGSFGISDLDTSEFPTLGKLGCTVTIRHPFPGVDRFSGFDVRGVFLGNGISTLQYDSLTYGGGPDNPGTEAVLLNPDGFTRWFNQPEFDGNGIPLFEYTPGKPSNLPLPTAMLNGFKIFADGLDKNADFHGWITNSSNAADRGIFRSSSVNSRRYRLQFPIIGGAPKINFQYAIIATWVDGNPSLTGDPLAYDPGDFPPQANCEEAFYVSANNDKSSLYNDGVGNYGGTFKSSIEVFDWQGGHVGGKGVPNEIQSIIVEGDFIPGGSFQFSKTDLAPLATSGTANSSVFSVEITDCAPMMSGDTPVWIIVEATGENADSYNQGFPAKYPPGARRAAFMRSAVAVSLGINNPPVITGIEDDIVGPGTYLNMVTWDHSSVTYSAIFTDPDVGQNHVLTWYVVHEGATPAGSDIVTMPHDWSTYEWGYYEIYVAIDDGFGPVMGGPFPILVLPNNVVFVDDSNTTGIEDGTCYHPYNTIQEGVDAAVPLDFDIWVDDSGNPYYEEVAMHTGTVLKSVNWMKIDGTNRAFIDGPDIDNAWSVKFDVVDNATLQGFKLGLTGKTDPVQKIYSETLKVIGGTGNSIIDCYFSGNTPFHGLRSIAAAGTENLTVSNCRFSEIDRLNNVGQCNYYTTLTADNCPGVTFSNNIITNIRPTEDETPKWMSLLLIKNTTGVILRNNLIHHIIFKSPNDANNIKGFELNTCSQVEVVNNTVDFLDVTVGFLIQQDFCYWFEVCYNVTFTNNIASRVYSNGLPPVLGRGVDAHYGDTVTLDYTCIFDTVVPYNGDVVEGTGYITSDPSYIDADNEIYDLNPASPCQNGDPSITDWDDSGSGGSRMGCHGGPGGELLGLLTPK